MAPSRDSLIARRRRFNVRVKEVEAALDRTDKTEVPDAVAAALDALYDQRNTGSNPSAYREPS
jgi:hypothetical protein